MPAKKALNARASKGIVWAMAAFGVIALAALLAPPEERAAAQDATPTPLSIIIVSRTPTEALFESPTPSRTPTTAYTTIRVEAITEANIRSAPDLTAEVYAKVKPGQSFGVSGRFGKWLQIQFPRSPTGVAWVYEEVVKITGGDPAAIPEINPDVLPTVNVSTAAAQRTSEFLTATPGAPETATALQASATGVFTRVAEGPVQPGVGVPLPTFTYPPPFAEATLPARAAATARGSLPPIIPIAGLLALGVAGLLISALRRGG